MKKVILLLALFAIGLIAFSQEITVRFTGQLNGTDYCRIDRVAVINVTRNWTEIVEYPDTIIVLGGTGGVNLNIAAVQGLGQNIPNPFDCETRVELSVSQREDVHMQLLDVAGKIYAEYNASLDAGVHTFDISAANPQTYLLNAIVGDRQYSIRMVNVGSGCGCSIKYAGSSNGIVAKLASTNEFLIGDNMRYVGYITIDGEGIASAIVEQMQVVSQSITLNFTHYFPPRVETLSATNITTTGATLNGNVTSNGGATVTARGFMYGTSASNLSQSVQSVSGTGSYTRALTGLSSGTTYYYKAYATNSVGTAYGEVRTFTTTGIPSVQTNSATDITATGAMLNGNVTSDGGATVTARGFMYGTSENDLSQRIQSGSGTGSYTKALTGLSCVTTYYYKAYATNSVGTAYGEVMSFTTEDASLPTVVTNNATNVTPTGGTLNGNVTDDGGATVTERGFIYGNIEFIVSASSLGGGVFGIGCSTVQCGSGTGSFTANITDFEDGTTVYYKAYATNCTGTAYGEVMSFMTGVSLPTVVTNGASNVTSTGATLNGNVTFNGGATVTERGFMYGTNASNLSQSVQSGSGTGSYTKALSGLSAGTIYYYKAYATNSEGTAYGEVMSFTTEDASLPTVVTYDATNVTSTGATLNGNVTDDGGATVTERGFFYSTDPSDLGIFISGTQVTSGSGTGDYSVNITGLSVGTTYYYRAYATNAAGTAFGEMMSFTANPPLPTVVTNNATNVTPTGGTLNGNVTDDGGATVTERGFIYGNIEFIVSASSLGGVFGIGCSTVQCGSGTGSFSANITDYDEGTTIYYKAYATNSTGTAYGEVMSFTTEEVATTGTLNGHEWVDLGLPSGLLWATCNVGASTPTGYGNYYAWGETTTKTTYKWTTYTYCNGSSSTLTKYCNISSYGNNGFTDNLTTLEAIDDAATANWGAGWRMPTDTEMQELVNNCTVTWTTQSGVNGRLFTGPNGNSIFLPAAGSRATSSLLSAGSRGRYWSSSLNPSISYMALLLYFDSDNYYAGFNDRYYGFTVRPVCVSQN